MTRAADALAHDMKGFALWKQSRGEDSLAIRSAITLADMVALRLHPSDELVGFLRSHADATRAQEIMLAAYASAIADSLEGKEPPSLTGEDRPRRAAMTSRRAPEKRDVSYWWQEI
jgi:hypothetical protein